MKNCTTCTAPLKDVTEPCPFCGTLGPEALAAKQAREAKQEAEQQAAQQRAAFSAARERAQAQGEVDQAGKRALWASLVGIGVCCFFPIGPILGVVFGLRSRRLAAQHGLLAPTSGTAGLAFGVFGLVLAVGLWIVAGVMQVKESGRKAELKRVIGEAQVLDLKTACALAELETIVTHYQGYSALDDFECDHTGELEVDGDSAVLTGVHFTNGGKRIELVGCFSHGSRWSVKQLRGDTDCLAPPPPKDAPATKQAPPPEDEAQQQAPPSHRRRRRLDRQIAP